VGLEAAGDVDDGGGDAAAPVGGDEGGGFGELLRVGRRRSIERGAMMASLVASNGSASPAGREASRTPAVQRAATRTPRGPTSAARKGMKVSTAASAGPVPPIGQTSGGAAVALEPLVTMRMTPEPRCAM